MIDVSPKVRDDKRIYIDEIYNFFYPYFSEQIALFIACQFALESYYGSSVLAQKFNNHCGMKVPRVRLHVGLASSDSFSHYRNLSECCLDYLLWLSWNRFLPKHFENIFQFKTKLRSCGYCPESGYYDRIQKIYDQYAPLIFNQIV